MVEAAAPRAASIARDDGGATWTRVNTQPALTRGRSTTQRGSSTRRTRTSSASTIALCKSTDGGRTFTVVRDAARRQPRHLDQPRQPNILIESNDGGANVTLDGGKTLVARRTTSRRPRSIRSTSTTSTRTASTAPQQDNTHGDRRQHAAVSSAPDDPLQDWRRAPAARPARSCRRTQPAHRLRRVQGPVQPHEPARPGRNSSTGSTRSTATATTRGHPYRFQRISPMEISPHDPNIVYYGSQYVHRTRDEGVTWDGSART